MSKATDWRQRSIAVLAERPRQFRGKELGSDTFTALVNDLGECSFNRKWCSAADAAALGRWLLDTFGDEP